jgi:lipopolysaccharide export system ATP-binding protein
VAKSFRAIDLFKIFKGRIVVNDVNLAVNTGEIVGLLGPNGAGKSTTFYIMVGRILPDSGQVMINGHNASAMPMYRRARLGVGYLPQEPSVFRNLSVTDNIKLVLTSNKTDSSAADQECERLLEEMGLTQVAAAQGYSLSGGERRRVEIARCLAMKPNFILLDEPFSGIDPVAVADLQELISSLREKGYGILLTDHNVRETLAITDRAYLMYQGKIFLEGSPDQIKKDPEAKK